MKRKWLLFVPVLIVAGWWAFRGSAPIVPPTIACGEPVIQRALNRAREEVIAQPGDAGKWGHYGKLLRAHGRDAEAGECFERAAQLDPNDPTWPYFIGLRLVLGQPEKAMPFLKRAGELPHENAERRDAVRLRYAESLLGEARIDEAERIVQEVLKERPDDPRSRFNLGLIAVAREQWEQAKSLLEPLEKNLFARKKVYAQLATIHFRLGHNVEAENYQMQAERAPTDLYWIDPFITEINRMEVGRQSQWGQIQRLESEGRLREANRLLVEQAQLFGDTKTFLVLGINFTKLKEWSNAEIALREALRLDPEAVQGYVFLGIALCEQSKWDESLEALRAALKRKPDQVFAHLYAGRALLELKRPVEAVEALREAVRCRPEQADTHMRLGEALMEAKQRDEGIRELTIAVELAPPEDPRPRQMLEKYR